MNLWAAEKPQKFQFQDLQRELVADGKIILKGMLKIMGGKEWTDTLDSRLASVVGLCNMV
jgi:hypothetical protein